MVRTRLSLYKKLSTKRQNISDSNCFEKNIDGKKCNVFQEQWQWRILCLTLDCVNDKFELEIHLIELIRFSDYLFRTPDRLLRICAVICNENSIYENYCNLIWTKWVDCIIKIRKSTLFHLSDLEWFLK